MFKALKPSTRVLELYCKGYMSVSCEFSTRLNSLVQVSVMLMALAPM